MKSKDQILLENLYKKVYESNTEPLIKKVSREDCEEVRYLLEYYDVNGD